MGPIVAGVLGGLLNIFGAAARNEAIRKQADANYNATLLSLGVQRGVEETNLLFQGNEINRQLGFELMNVGREEKKVASTAAANTIERDIYGNTASRTQNQVAMDAAQIRDNLAQSASAAQSNVQTGLVNAMYNYNNGKYAASQNRANAYNQMQGPLEIVAGGVSSGFNFASGYRSMKGM